MSPARVPHPRRQVPADYFLRCMGGEHRGLLYGGLDAAGLPLWVDAPAKAMKMRGAGLASAEHSLTRRGFAVERVQS